MEDRLATLSIQTSMLLQRTKSRLPTWYTPPTPIDGADIPPLNVDSAFNEFSQRLEASCIPTHCYFSRDRRKQDAMTARYLQRMMVQGHHCDQSCHDPIACPVCLVQPPESMHQSSTLQNTHDARDTRAQSAHQTQTRPVQHTASSSMCSAIPPSISATSSRSSVSTHSSHTHSSTGARSEVPLGNYYSGTTATRDGVEAGGSVGTHDSSQTRWQSSHRVHGPMIPSPSHVQNACMHQEQQQQVTLDLEPGDYDVTFTNSDGSPLRSCRVLLAPRRTHTIIVD
eukprot:m.5192 g.5192  ORF g.5192 m.5192 type:complete len:283 (-) comp4858_c1_seq1:641-1489(-)